MEYHEKLSYAEESLTRIEQGVSIEKIKNNLSDLGLMQYDIVEVERSINNLLEEKFLPQIKVDLLAGNFEVNESSYSILDKLTVEQLKAKGIQSIIDDSKMQVNKFVREGSQDTEIIDKVQNEFYDKSEIEKQISFYKNYNEAPTGHEKTKYLAIGIPLFLIGVALTIYLFVIGARRPFIGIALAIFGGWYIYKAFTPPGVAEMSPMSDKFG